MLKPGFPKRLILSSIILLTALVVPAHSQGDDAPGSSSEAKTEKPGTFSSTIGKIFGRKEDRAEENARTKSIESDQDRGTQGPSIPGKPSFGFSRSKTVPAQTTGNRGGGIFVPLRSFTNRVFRGGDDQDLAAIRIEAEEEYSTAVTMPDTTKSVNRSEFGLGVTAPPTDDLPKNSSAEDDPDFTNEVGSALKSNPPQRTSVEPFSGTRSTNAASRNREPSEPKKSQLLPPPPSLVPTPNNNASGSSSPAGSASNDRVYSGAQTPSSRVGRGGGVAPASPGSAKNYAPIVNSTPNLEEKSTSRRTPTGATGITESMELPGSRTDKPANLVDLSNEGGASGPASVSRSRSGLPLASSQDATSDETSGSTTDLTVASTSEEPMVTRNRVPELKKEKPSSTRNTVPSPNTTSMGLPQVTAGIQDKQQEQIPSLQREPAGQSAGALLDLKQPGISLQISGPNAMVVGQESIYEVIAKNQGSSNLNGLIVRLALPNSVTIGNAVATSGVSQPDREDGDNAILWEVESIAAGQSQSLKLPLKAASPEHFALNVEWTALPQSQSLQVNVHEPKLDLALEGPAEAEYGVPQKYRLRIKNPGNAVAKTVEVRLAAESFGSNQSMIGDIAPGAERVIDVELLFEQGGVIPIVASATSVASQVQSQSQIEVRVRQAKLVARWEGANNYYQGSVGDYRLILSNEGDAPINQARCNVSLPNGAEAISLPPGSVRKGASVQWDVKKLMPGEFLPIPFRLSFTQLGKVELVFQSQAKNSESIAATHAVVVDAVEDLKLAVIPPVAPAPVDQPVAYEIEIHNRGTKSAQNVAVLAQFSEGVEPVKVEGHEGQIVPGQVVFQTIPAIGPNQRITLKVFAKASTSGIHRFRAEVKGASGESDLVQEGSTRYMASGVQPQVRR